MSDCLVSFCLLQIQGLTVFMQFYKSVRFEFLLFDLVINSVLIIVIYIKIL